MTEGSEVRASHEEVEGFVAKLRDFHGSLSTEEQAMMSAILESAQAGETGGYGARFNGRYVGREEQQDAPQQEAPWNDLVGWIEEQGGEDTQGFAIRGKV